MGSEGNRINDGTEFQPSEPKLCANGCGFFGTAATMNLCSKCYRDLRIKEEQAVSAKAVMDKLVKQSQPETDGFSTESRVGSSAFAEPSAVGVSESVVPAAATVACRCSSCNRKVGVVGFQCRCEYSFCGSHRYPEKHDCSFDFKAVGRDAIAKANPLVKADKLETF